MIEYNPKYKIYTVNNYQLETRLGSVFFKLSTEAYPLFGSDFRSFIDDWRLAACYCLDAPATIPSGSTEFVPGLGAKQTYHARVVEPTVDKRWFGQNGKPLKAYWKDNLLCSNFRKVEQYDDHPNYR